MVPPDPFPALFCALEADPIHCIPGCPVPCHPAEFGFGKPWQEIRGWEERGLHHWGQLCSSTLVVPVTSFKPWQYRRLPLLLQVSWPRLDVALGASASAHMVNGPSCSALYWHCLE